MKNKPKLLFIVGVCSFTIIALIAGIIFLIKRDNVEYDNSIPDNDRTLLTLYKENLVIENEVPFEKGDRINVILKDSNTEYEYNKNPYMENVKIYEVKENTISLWIPFDYEPFITSMQGSPFITIEIAKATDPKGAFKVNKELHKLLDEKYSISSNKEKNKKGN